MQKRSFTDCYNNSPLLLTEGAIGLRVEHEYNIRPDKDVMYAGLIYGNARNALSALYRQYLQTAKDFSLPIMLMTNTRRANRERVMRSRFAGNNMMSDYTEFLFGLVREYGCEAYVGGMMGCKGDAYGGGEGLSTSEAIEFHSWQAERFSDTKPDFMIAGLMPCLPEAIGIAKVIETLGLPYIISLMICKEGTLLDGNTINDAIAAIDEAADRKPLFYMTTCVHPYVLKEALSKPFNSTPLVRERFRGIQANASPLSLSELDKSTEPKTSNAEELSDYFLALHKEFPLKVYGGCCGTDDTHLRAIAAKMKGLCY